MAGYLLAIALVGLMTGVVALFRVTADVENVSMLYLLAVIASAVAFGRGPAIAAAIGSFLAFNFFFVEPRYTFTVAQDEELVALALLLITGIITGQLAALLRERARDAERREREAVALYDVVRLVAEPDIQRALTAVAEKLRSDLDLATVLIAVEDVEPVRAQADVGDSEAIELARAAAMVPGMVLGGGQSATRETSATPGRWIRVVDPKGRSAGAPVDSKRVRSVPLMRAGTRVGSITLVRRRDAAEFSASDDRLLSAVAHQVGLALERVRLQREATEAEVLRRTDELRTALINAVSHDLRTPLSSIIASAGSLLQVDVDWSDDDKRQFAGAIVEEAERLNRLVSNLLDLGRIESGIIRPDKGWYDIGSLVNEVAGRLRPLASRHRLRVEVPDGLPPLQFDYVEIDQVLTNLVENALKYTPEGSEITVSLRLMDDRVEVSVSDNGPGIPANALENVFKPFYQVATAAGQAKGSGLGLAVARGLVEAHGGGIRAENRLEGGARFVFTLPRAETPVVAA